MHSGAANNQSQVLIGHNTSHLHVFHVVAIIGFNETAYTFEEGDGTVEVCAAFLNPTQHLTNLWGVGALSSVSYSNHKRVPISHVQCP